MICGSGDIMNEKRNKVILKDVLGPKGYIRGPFGSALKRGELLDKGIPVYEQQHAITESRTFRFYINDEKFESMKRFQVQENDLIISCSGTIGCVSIIGPDDPKGIISQALLILRANTDVVLPQYLKYYFTSKKGYNAIVSRSSGSVQVNIAKREIIEQIELDLPDITAQKKIVGVLEALDKKISNNNVVNDNLQQQVMELFRKMFIDTINDSRHECRADEYFDISIGKTPPRKEPQWFSMNSNDRVWVSISDMGNSGLYIADSSEYLTHKSVEKFNVKVVPDNTVLLSFKLTVGRVAITDGEMTTNEAIAHFKTDKPEITEYLYCYLKGFNYQTMGSTSSIATAVNSKIIKAMPFIVPTDDELAEFHAFAAPMFALIKANQRENVNLADLRDSLLPHLMSGDIDMSNIDA